MNYRRLIKISENDEEFQEIVKDIIENKEFQKIKKLKVHGNTSLFDHCYAVSYFCYLTCKKKKLDYKSAARRSYAS